MRQKLISDLTQYHRDFDAANKFISIFGYEEYDRVNPYVRDELIQHLKTKMSNDKLNQSANNSSPNANLNSNSTNNVNNSSSLPNDKYYYPVDELYDEKIKFVASEDDFKMMLKYFEDTKPTVAGSFFLYYVKRLN